MFQNLSIQKKMNYFIGMVTFAVFSAAISIFLAMNHVESEYDHLHKNSMIGGLTTLKIEKSLNYISRTSRDIILGGNYDKNMAKLKDKIDTIQNHFIKLEELMADDEYLDMVVEAKSSTMLFLDNSYKMMQSLTPDDIQNDKITIYAKYKHDLTPFANKSRESFKKLVDLKADELDKDSSSLGTIITFFKYLVLVAGTIVGFVVLIFATMIRKSIVEGIREFTKLIGYVANGDFSHKIENTNESTELGVMGRDRKSTR